VLEDNVIAKMFWSDCTAANAIGSVKIVEIEEADGMRCQFNFEVPNAEERAVSIGYTFLEKAAWGSGTNREMKELMLKYIFYTTSTVWFGVGEINLRSRKAVEKLGASLSHKEERELDGRPYVQLFYKLGASEYCA
jgi:RimJ/RimL family protein N-acetyltransferase